MKNWKKFNLRAKSHFIVGDSLLRGLAKVGHQVTMISSFKPSKKVSNYTHIEIEGISEIMKGLNSLTYVNTISCRKIILTLATFLFLLMNVYIIVDSLLYFIHR
jgi:hypothetical protein